MATSTTTVFPIPVSALRAGALRAGVIRRRQISPQAGLALRKLDRAIEHLSDEIAYAGGPFSEDNPKLQAVLILSALNRQIYFECPELPTLAERFRAFLHPQES